MKKKIIKILAIAAVLALIGAFAAACDPEITTASIVSIEVKADTLPTEIAQFTTPDWSGVKILVTFDDETVKEYSVDFTFSEIDTDTLGEKTVTVTYGDYSATFTVDVVLATKVVESIAVKADTFDDEVYYGATYNYADITVELTYENDYKEDIPSTDSRLNIETVNTSALGTQTITVSFSDEFNTTPVTTTFDVAVVLQSYVIESITAKEGTYQVYVPQFSDPDYSELFVSITYDNDVTIDYPSTIAGLTISENDDFDTLGQKTVTLSYTDSYNTTPVTYSYNVTVVQVTYEISSIAVKAGTTPSVIYRDETPDWSSVVVIATLANQVTRNIYAPDLTFSNLDISTVGEDKVVTVSYTDEFNPNPISTTFTVDVIISPYIVESITVDEASVTDVNQYSDADFDDIDITVEYLDGHSIEIKGSNNNVTFSTVDTNTLGDQTVTVSYRDSYNNTPITDDFAVTVISTTSLEDGYQLIEYAMPEFINTYLSNTSVSTTGENAYMDKDQAYYVGSLNSFKILPQMTALKIVSGTPTSKVLTSYTSDYAVEIWNDVTSAYEPLTGTDLTDMVTIEGAASAFDFNTSANGERFRLTLSAKPGDIFGAYTLNPLHLEIEVIDAYNVYNAADLSVFDNFNNHGYWTDLKEDNSIDPDLDVNGIVLHNNIVITPEDLPSTFFYQAEEADPATYKQEGSLKKWSYIYVRSGDIDETFNFIGNYFSIDASAIPLGTEKNEETATPLSYSSLFCFLQSSAASSDITLNGGSEGGSDINNVNKATNNMKNITLIGNATRAPGEDEMIRMGGLIMLKSNAYELNVYNTIMRRNFSDIYVVNRYANFLMDKSKAYDSYCNSMMFYENIDTLTDPEDKTMLIKDSEIKRCGGPAIILDDYDNPSAGTNFTNNDMAYLEIENSTVESYVQGTEGWFKANGATAAMGLIKGLDLVFNAYGRTFTQDRDNDGIDEAINIMVLMMHNNPFTDNYVLRAWLKIDGVVVSSTLDDNVSTYQDTVSPAPVFQSSEGVGLEITAGGTCLYSNLPTDDLYTLKAGFASLSTGLPDPVLTGDYITCYVKPGASYLGIVMGYYEYVA